MQAAFDQCDVDLHGLGYWPAGFYEMIQTDTTSSKYKTYQFSQGYSTMSFNAKPVGIHMLFFVENNQPSNVVIIDVLLTREPPVSAKPDMQHLR